MNVNFAVNWIAKKKRADDEPMPYILLAVREKVRLKPILQRGNKQISNLSED